MIVVFLQMQIILMQRGDKMEILEIFNHEFIIKAFITGILVSLCAALLGVSLVLKRYSMIGDGLSHVSFGTLSIAAALGLSPLQVSIPVVIISAFFLLRLSENSKLKSDSAIAILSSSSLAIGVTITALTGEMNDVCAYMFGSILSVTDVDLYISVVISIIVITMFVICYNKIFAITFDEIFAKATGVNVKFYNSLIAVLTAVTIVMGMQIMGAMLISSLIIFPALTSMRIFKSFLSVVICSAILSVVCFCIGLIISYVYSTPAGASVVIVNLIMFLIFTLISKTPIYKFLNS